jgi:PhzF family phenazine biosynthesis protein
MLIYQVDSFTDKLFRGNPAGVAISDIEIEDTIMQNIAMEMNLSETAFLIKEKNYYNLRWFTPDSEVNLCGHATLACAHILFETKRENQDSEIIFSTKSGILKAKRENDKIVLDFPLQEDIKLKYTPNFLKEAFKTDFIYCGKNDEDYILEVENYEILKSIKPDFELLKEKDSRGIIVTTKSSDERYDFISRFFAPSVGIDEDPVTGSAHCCLAPYWSRKLNKNKFKAYQASKRGGSLEIELVNNRVLLKGKAITFINAKLNVNI